MVLLCAFCLRTIALPIMRFDHFRACILNADIYDRTIVSVLQCVCVVSVIETRVLH